MAARSAARASYRSEKKIRATDSAGSRDWIVGLPKHYFTYLETAAGDRHAITGHGRRPERGLSTRVHLFYESALVPSPFVLWFLHDPHIGQEFFPDIFSMNRFCSP